MSSVAEKVGKRRSAGSDPRTIEARAKRALAVWEAADREVGALEIFPDGCIRILAPDAVGAVPSPRGGNSCDDLFGTESE